LFVGHGEYSFVVIVLSSFRLIQPQQLRTPELYDDEVQLRVAAQQGHAASGTVLPYLRLCLLPLPGGLLVGGVGLQVF
jgi:hypothetical protein